MRQFERWWVRQDEYYDMDTCGHKDTAEAGWKAALEWTMTNKKPIKYNDYKFDYIKTDVIEEELNSAPS